MALNIEPTFLPADGPFERGDLERIVEGISISGFGADDFGDIGGGAVASTEPPDTPARGTLWFKRGDGRLYQYVTAFHTVQGEDSASSGSAHWVAISDRRDIIVRYGGQLLGNTGVQDNERYRPHMMWGNCSGYSSLAEGQGFNVMHTIANGDEMSRLFKDFGFPPGFSTETITYPNTTYNILTDIGFCKMMLHSGATGPAPGVFSETGYTGLHNKQNPYTVGALYSYYITESLAAATFSEDFNDFYDVFAFSERRRKDQR